MSRKHDQLILLLKELFQLDRPELDFGLYRIMHVKAGEITHFLDNELLPQVREAFKEQCPSKEDTDTFEKGTDIAQLENEVYDHLYRFFRRYYQDGDFLPNRVYKPGVYAIPYEGEEVKLHWANRDQYYIKSGRSLSDYVFKLKPHQDDESHENPMRVRFRLVGAVEEEHDNVKAADGDRVLVLASEPSIVEEVGELVIRFEDRPARMGDWPEDERKSQEKRQKRPKPPKQKELTERMVNQLLAVEAESLRPWMAELAKPEINTNGQRVGYSRLKAHLERFVARNSFDYFIHKDLGGFLRRELDFYVKNEVMHLDDLESGAGSRLEQCLSKIKVIRKIAHKIIEFLAQLEEFQKKLWLKKKFVVEAHYCITLDRIPEAFYPEIAQNDAQRREWARLFKIDNLKAKFGYSEPLTTDFLRAHPYLPLDTALFPKEMAARILENLHGLEDQTNGLLVQGENYQAIRLLQRRYEKGVKCTYIDPPYNSLSSEIAYKNNYKHSSWLSLMHDRLEAARSLSTEDGSCVIAIDENERNGLERICMEMFPDCSITTVAIEHNRKGVQGRYFSYTNDFAVFVLSPELAELNRAELPETEWEYANLRNWGGESLRHDGRNCFYPIYVKDHKIVGFGDVCDDDFHPARPNVQMNDGTVAVYPVDADGVERKWRYARETVAKIKRHLKVDKARSGHLRIMKAKADTQFKTVWYGSRYNAGDYGTKVLTNMGFEKGRFDFPKSLYTVRDCVFAVSNSADMIFDYFAGSGTTAHAVISLNRQDGGSRGYLLVEMGDYFDTVTKPRVVKAAYSSDWREGRPKSEDGLSQVVKYLRLESYEDTLNNLELNRTEARRNALASTEAQGDGGLKEQYLLRYFLDVETRGSNSLLNIDAFLDPTNYKLKVKPAGSGASRETQIDLLETFNYLIGLRVEHIAAPQTVTVALERSPEGHLGLQGPLEPDPTGDLRDLWWFRTVRGTLPDGKRALVIWRKMPKAIELGPREGAEQDNLVLNEWLKRRGLVGRDHDLDLIYVNGDHNLEVVRAADDTWKARLIEEDFHRLMFEG